MREVDTVLKETCLEFARDGLARYRAAQVLLGLEPLSRQGVQAALKRHNLDDLIP